MVYIYPFYIIVIFKNIKKNSHKYKLKNFLKKVMSSLKDMISKG